MILGEMLPTGANANSPWFRRFGDAATFFCEVSAATKSASLTVTIETKNEEDADGAASPLTSKATDGTGVTPVRASGFKELVRFSYSVAYAADPPPEETGCVHFRMLPPAWEDNCVEAIPG